MKKILFGLWAFLLCTPFAYAQEKSAINDPYHDWFTYYYMDKNTTKVPDFLKWLQQSAILENNAERLAATEGFLSIVFKDNAAQADGWNHLIPYTGKAKEAVEYAAHHPTDPGDLDIKTSQDIDKVWGAFFASGDTQYLQKIVNVLEPKKSFFGKEKQDMSLHKAAAWSLGSNMTQHEAVDRFLQNESKKRQGKVAEELSNIMADVQKQRDARAFPHRNGDFSAMMFVTDPVLAESELAHASNNIIHFKEMTHAKIGDKRTLVIVFAGQELSPEYKADVTYDVQLSNPTGKIYSDLKNLEALKQKVPTRFRIFNNKAAIFIDFDAKDKKGIYKINVLLKDNIANKAIPLNSSILLGK